MAELKNPNSNRSSLITSLSNNGVSEADPKSFLNPSQPFQSPHPSSSSSPFSQPTPQNLRRLSPSEHAYLIHALSSPSIPLDLEAAQTPSFTPPTSTLWPPRRLPPSLYRTIILSRSISAYQYILLSVFFSVLLIAQLLLGASLTALSSHSTSETSSGEGKGGWKVSITVLAAANTIIAGLIALMHNSGLPDRYKKDRDVFDAVELRVRGLMEMGVVGAEQSVEQVVAGCWDGCREARRVVAENKPSNYVGGANRKDGK